MIDGHDTQTSSKISKLQPGEGHLVLTLHGSSAVLSELSSTFPLKLLSPRETKERVAVVYILTYGGGLVSGDTVSLTGSVNEGTLVLLTQGSTKVFKSHPTRRLSSLRPLELPQAGAETIGPGPLQTTSQNLSFSVSFGGTVCLLPDPVTCFRAASYHQVQTFFLAKDASLVLLDWVTSGRKSTGEEWCFARYWSVNEVWREGQEVPGKKRLIRDVMLLESNHDREADTKLPQRGLAEKMGPYACYATVLLCGPRVQRVIGDLTARYGEIVVFKEREPAGLVWSLSSIDDGEMKGAIVRVGGSESEVVRRWLADALRSVEDVVGLDTFRRAFS